MDTITKIRHTGVRILVTILCIIILKGLLAFSHHFEGWYFHRFYFWISNLLRVALGSILFSVGDVIYAAWVITGSIYLLKLCYKLIKTQWKESFLYFLKGISAVLTLYLAFLVLWGFNYDRYSLEKDMQLQVNEYGTEQLYKLADTLLQQVNANRIEMGDTLNATRPGADSAQLFQRAVVAYDQAAKQWPVLKYTHPCLKTSLYGTWMNYMNVGGYLNPFTGEAQVNVTTPGFLHPFTICHEVAHQLGYGAEEEANFIGYLVAGHAKDVRFRYAANFEMFMYSIRQLRWQDTTMAKNLWQKAVPGVHEDYHQLKNFYRRYSSPVDDYTSMIYDQYLKANKQEKGIRSYSEVVGWLVAYFHIH
ncbi:DUF3810 domain-containing protein [[Flexibacter] sp. ATCC 35208]|uniref:DUF3810 domain-containing protein n=1 Tax=[Flexibacter] sp. ATCC 35208 TaxID=1936242 RepID=UPI0009CD7E3A|nr:DUF3810 domain-containing protein [[Flexibacter] sp. ATCC 35208]OMP77261.1 hypothetical protein BW716_20805 [[Flexibacter] sp. ATCC 35208]